MIGDIRRNRKDETEELVAQGLEDPLLSRVSVKAPSQQNTASTSGHPASRDADYRTALFDDKLEALRASKRQSE
ncbi:hypothetical protein CBA19CS22_39495 [Caballeronia novacaledonica]|uniref:Uncharacterized protein n=1 Tax=Caballeronia novacaledonica TaxID=1544861 RepID=A0ACB5R6M8_9BURK|nr:hypothetical protein [Caballeronia sp. LZ029]MDR5749055.1 hypothetical protein [Caballeronia sp. LZ029]GJH22763.1 hypothetical protein CBA19CS22_39495 [Caballeronia novacaledonica]